MSKRRHGTGGASDALVHAIVGLGAVPGWAKLPPPTKPGSRGRALGQGVLHGRLPRGDPRACLVDATPLPIQSMQQEGQRSVAELGAILWLAMDGAREAPELEPWMAAPHTDPIIALSISRRHLAEYAVPEAIDRNAAFPGERVWLVEIERAKGDVPGGIAVWRSRGAHGEWRTRCACVWTHGRIGSTTHPLVIGAQWDTNGNDAAAGACVIGPSWDDATGVAGGAAVLARRQNAIGKQMMARIVVPAALAWLDHHGGVARPAGRFGAQVGHTLSDRAGPGRPACTVRPAPAVARTQPPPWLSADVERAVEAIVIGAAREGFRIGASCPAEAWRRGWAGYAEMGAVAWHPIADRKAQIDAATWVAMERAACEDRLAPVSVHPGLAATSALVRKMLEQTGRNHVARAPDARALCALEVSAKLWRALAEAGPARTRSKRSISASTGGPSRWRARPTTSRTPPRCGRPTAPRWRLPPSGGTDTARAAGARSACASTCARTGSARRSARSTRAGGGSWSKATRPAPRRKTTRSWSHGSPKASCARATTRAIAPEPAAKRTREPGTGNESRSR